MNTKIKCALISGVALSVFPFLAQAGIVGCVNNEQGYRNISGEYVCTAVCNPSVGSRAFINQSGFNLSLINGAGQVSTGSVTGVTSIYASTWRLDAAILNNCQELWFTNGSVWLRK